MAMPAADQTHRSSEEKERRNGKKGKKEEAESNNEVAHQDQERIYRNRKQNKHVSFPFVWCRKAHIYEGRTYFSQ